MLCHSRWPKDKLFSACRCYKKSGAELQCKAAAQHCARLALSTAEDFVPSDGGRGVVQSRSDTAFDLLLICEFIFCSSRSVLFLVCLHPCFRMSLLSRAHADNNRLHRECLAQLYAIKETDELPRCPDCHDVYRVSVKYTFFFAWNRVLTCRSIGHLCEILIILFMILCGQSRMLRHTCAG